MPVYEQKLISPFAIRFTQEHIRTTFRDGRLVEASLNEVQALPGTDGYDIVLRAPFPNIEIIRWSSPCQAQGAAVASCCPVRKEEGRCTHWFTLDNRRLYCLQCAAAVHWPRRVAVVVDLLYADPGSVRKKYDSTTHGCSVSVRHSCKGPELGTWRWQEGLPCGAAAAALEAVHRDDARASAQELLDAPEEEGSLLALAHGAAPLEQLTKSGGGGCPTPSTIEASEDSEGAEEVLPPPPEEVLLLAVKRGLAGVWYGGEGETYRFRFGAGTDWTCVRQGAKGARTFTATYDADNDVIWWGTNGAFYIGASEMAEEPDELRIYAVGDRRARKPRFVWHRRGCGPSSSAAAELPAAGSWPAKGPTRAKAGAPGVRPAAGQSDRSAAAAPPERRAGRAAAAGPEGGRRGPKNLADAALAEAEAQLRQPSNEGFVWIEGWNERYARHLGPLRAFLERHPERVRVTPGRGSRYTVSLTGDSGVTGSGCCSAEPGGVAIGGGERPRADAEAL
uniref:Uncharacterized protein n=1 Tax=Pyrodinium bahamense TaxID=73915 RepID=A0A7S0A724_9DINO